MFFTLNFFYETTYRRTGVRLVWTHYLLFFPPVWPFVFFVPFKCIQKLPSLPVSESQIRVLVQDVIASQRPWKLEFHFPLGINWGEQGVENFAAWCVGGHLVARPPLPLMNGEAISSKSPQRAQTVANQLAVFFIVVITGIVFDIRLVCFLVGFVKGFRKLTERATVNIRVYPSENNVNSISEYTEPKKMGMRMISFNKTPSVYVRESFYYTNNSLFAFYMALCSSNRINYVINT